MNRPERYPRDGFHAVACRASFPPPPPRAEGSGVLRHAFMCGSDDRILLQQDARQFHAVGRADCLRLPPRVFRPQLFGLVASTLNDCLAAWRRSRFSESCFIDRESVGHC
jgi:hypothetical protein